jgi:hypothetical protein
MFTLELPEVVLCTTLFLVHLYDVADHALIHEVRPLTQDRTEI